MKVLVTGGAGFIGSHLVDKLIALGNEVTIVDNLSTGCRENINPKAEFPFAYDIRYTKLDERFKYDNFDAIFHLAAQIDVTKSISNPKFDADVNILGSLNLLQAAINWNVRYFIFSSSGGAIYGDSILHPDESAKLCPLSPYGVSKLAFEKYIEAYRHINEMSMTTLRYANVYGPRQRYDGEGAVIPTFIIKMLKNEDIFIRGDGTQVRDFVYVDDVVNANLDALNDKGGCVYNICSGSKLTINALFYIIAGLVGYTKHPTYVDAIPGEIKFSTMNNEKAERLLNWYPGTRLVEGLKKTVEYFKEEK